MRLRAAWLVPGLILGQARAAVPSPPPVQATFYVAPPEAGGSDGHPGTIDRPFASLARARDAVRPLAPGQSGDLVIYLRGGTYRQAETLVFTPADSGNNGFAIRYEAYGDEVPVLSGGRVLTGWTRVEGSDAWQAPAPGLETRQLYVDGLRAERASASTSLLGALEQTDDGYFTANRDLASWRNPADIELVFTGGGGVPGAPWTESRCGIRSIAPLGPDRVRIKLKQPCYGNGRARQHHSIGLPTAIENAFELLTAPGQWYLDRAAGIVYAIPRPGQDLSVAEVVAPVVEGLVRGDGTPEEPVHDLVFRGLTFAEATWLEPSGDDGFIEIQANERLVGQPMRPRMTPASVHFHGARRLRFERCRFERLGAQGLALDRGSQDNRVVGCRFTDISGTPLRLGDVDAPDEPAERQDRGNRIENNLIYGAPVEFHGGTALFAGYTADTTIAHNEIANTPYSGISLGWGWGEGGVFAPHAVHHNRVHDVMGRLRDGGAFYSLTPRSATETARSTLSYNWLFNDPQPYGAIYFDQGSGGWGVHHNLVNNTPTDWIYLQWLAPPATDIEVAGNYHDTDGYSNGHPSNTLRDNARVGPGAYPAEAWSIANGSGLEPAYLDLAGNGVPRNVARGRPTSASSAWSGSFARSAANDGDALTGWSPAAGDRYPWWEVDLGAPYTLSEIQLLTRQDFDQPETRRNFEIWASNQADMSAGHVVLGGRGTEPLPYWGWLRLPVADPTPYRYLAAVKTRPEYFFISELRVFATGGPPAAPKEPSPAGAPLKVARAPGGGLQVRYTPGCGATDHAAYWGLTPIGGQVEWRESACGLGVSGVAAFDPGTPPPGQALYFVLVGQSDRAESSYGHDLDGRQRPEAVGIGSCDRPQILSGICP